MPLANIALYCSKAERRVPGWVVGGGWCKPIFVSNPQPSCFGLLLGWVAVAWLGFGVMTIKLHDQGKYFKEALKSLTGIDKI